MFNRTILQGRIPSSEKIPFDINEYTDEKKAVLRGMISVPRNYKREGEQYPQEDLILFKAFGTTAVFIHKNYHRGDYVILEGELRKDDDYTKDGQTVRGQLYVHVVQGGINWQKGNPKSDSTEAAAEKAPAADSKKFNPLAGKSTPKPAANPFKKSPI